MNREELKYELIKLNVNKSYYSLDGELNPDSIVLYENYKIWEVFYFDEKGDRNDCKFFTSEDLACEYIYNLFVSSSK